MLVSIQLLIPSLLAFSTLVTALPGQRKQRSLNIPIANPNAAGIIANSYVVVYNANCTDEHMAEHVNQIKSAVHKRSLKARSTDGRLLSREVNTYSMSGWRAMTLDAEDAMIKDIASSSMVTYVEADAKVSIAGLVQQVNAPAGLERISHPVAGADGYVFDNSAGSGITVYVVDTGIRTTHTDFGGRASFGINTVSKVQTDDNGHGSHVAGTVGGSAFGVAKNATLVAVKVLDASGGGSNVGVIKGLQFVLDDVTQRRKIANRAVVNMSVGGSFSRAINAAVAALSRAGVTVVTAAGNENVDASSTSPASAESAITVGAIDAKTDVRAPFSNFGPVVDVFAPGVRVQSVGFESDTAVKTLSGTSMASPHVAGLAAYLIGLENLPNPAAVMTRIKDLGTKSGARVTNPGTGTTNPIIANNGDGI